MLTRSSRPAAATPSSAASAAIRNRPPISDAGSRSAFDDRRDAEEHVAHDCERQREARVVRRLPGDQRRDAERAAGDVEGDDAEAAGAHGEDRRRCRSRRRRCPR